MGPGADDDAGAEARADATAGADAEAEADATGGGVADDTNTGALAEVLADADGSWWRARIVPTAKIAAPTTANPANTAMAMAAPLRRCAGTPCARMSKVGSLARANDGVTAGATAWATPGLIGCCGEPSVTACGRDAARTVPGEISITVAGTAVDGTTVEGTCVDGTCVAGTCVDGTTVGDMTVDAIAVDGTCVCGTTVGGTTVEGTSCEAFVANGLREERLLRDRERRDHLAGSHRAPHRRRERRQREGREYLLARRTIGGLAEEHPRDEVVDVRRAPWDLRRQTREVAVDDRLQDLTRVLPVPVRRTAKRKDLVREDTERPHVTTRV